MFFSHFLAGLVMVMKLEVPTHDPCVVVPTCLWRLHTALVCQNPAVRLVAAGLCYVCLQELPEATGCETNYHNQTNNTYITNLKNPDCTAQADKYSISSWNTPRTPSASESN